MKTKESNTGFVFNHPAQLGRIIYATFEINVADPELIKVFAPLIENLGFDENWVSDPQVRAAKKTLEKATRPQNADEQSVGEKVYTLLVDKIYSTLIAAPEMGLGEMGGVRDEAERIVKEWMEESGVKLLD